MSQRVQYWLMKSEPDVYSINDLERDREAPWEGVRNYQARNFMRDEMRVGDMVLFYHSNASPPGVAGIARITREAYPDSASWDKRSPYYDKKSTKENPRWFMVDVEFVEKFPELVPLPALRRVSRLEDLKLLQKGQRLSVQPVEADHFNLIRTMGRRARHVST